MNPFFSTTTFADADFLLAFIYPELAAINFALE